MKSEKVSIKDRELYDIMGNYIFSEEEKKQLGLDLCQENLKIQGLEDEKRAVTSNFKAKIDQATAQVNLLSTHLSQGIKQQMYKCYLEFDRAAKMRVWKDAETDKVIKREPMRPEDAQIKFTK